MRRLFPRHFINSIRNSHFHYFICWLLEKIEMEGFTISYAQCGEDLIIKTIFGKEKRNGFYIDIGCNNPIQKSNTFKLYLKGWSGICVDGNPSLVDKCKKIRKRDICLTEIVSYNRREITFYQDDLNHELSSVDTVIGHEVKLANKAVKEIKTYSTTLENIFENYLPSGQIDLLCIDVENHDLEVLEGNNFQKYRPRIICIEFFGSFDELKSSKLDFFLADNGYELLVFSLPNAFYRDKTNSRSANS
jgi:FkbM family methyltransferase